MPRRLSRRFARNRRGNVAIIAALTLLPIVGIVGMGLDVGAALNRENRLQDASDSGALAALRAIDTKTDAQMRTIAENYIKSNVSDPFTIKTFTVDRTLRRVVVTATGKSDTVLGDIFGINYIEYVSESVAQGGGLTLEIAMSLDNSGSMEAQGRIGALRDAANSLVSILMDDPVLSGKVKIGVVPFASSVNVGAANVSQPWIDRTGTSPQHAENFYIPPASTSESASTLNRLTQFTRLGIPWGGCVEARAGGLDVTDAPATSGASLFVPMFAPDEPDVFWYRKNSSSPYLSYDDDVDVDVIAPAARIEDIYDNDGDGDRDEDFVPGYGGITMYYNDYIDDNGPNCTSGEIALTQQYDRQARTCKYRNATGQRYHPSAGVPNGPNFLCTTNAIQPLTGVKSVLTTQINAMQPLGGTNIAEGAAWGWRVLSPTAPFDQGVAYGTINHRKILIVMTDGDNQWLGDSWGLNHNASMYSPYGFSARQRIRTTTRSTAELSTAIDGRLSTICANVKAAGVVVYTVTLAPQTTNGQNIMAACASGPTFAHVAANSAQLVPVFTSIAESIKSIRLSH